MIDIEKDNFEAFLAAILYCPAPMSGVMFDLKNIIRDARSGLPASRLQGLFSSIR